MDGIQSSAQLRAILRGRPNRDAVEPTCLTLLALRHCMDTSVSRLLTHIKDMQTRDGSWPACDGDGGEGCWVTALAALALMATSSGADRVTPAIRWLVDAKGREANWFWRWKLLAVDNQVKIDPAKYGWSWVPGTTSWVIPTSFSILALRLAWHRGIDRTAELVKRVEIGTKMLHDRMCPGGGWNAGNGIAFGVSCTPYLDSTAIALLALSGSRLDAGVQTSFGWLVNHLPGCPSPYSLAWGVLALSAYCRESMGSASRELLQLIEKRAGLEDTGTLAICSLALDAVEGDNVFEVRG